jgi:hypothetical protein
MFESALGLFEEYCIKVGGTDPDSYNSDLAAEVTERLRQLEFILERISVAEKQYEDTMRRRSIASSEFARKLMTAGIKSPVPAPRELSLQIWIDAVASACLEIRVMTESFYYFANRIRTILRHKSAPLPHLSSFECSGVRDVRNHLIEHPEGADSQVFVQSFSFGGPNGPVLKDGRTAALKNRPSDQGLYRNASEFNNNLISALKSALARE